MNKRYEEGRKPFFSESGEKQRKQYVWAKNKEIENDYKLLKKISEMETAKKMIDEIWQCKSFANAIELELIRRGFYNGATS